MREHEICVTGDLNDSHSIESGTFDKWMFYCNAPLINCQMNITVK